MSVYPQPGFHLKWPLVSTSQAGFPTVSESTLALKELTISVFRQIKNNNNAVTETMKKTCSRKHT